MPSRTKKLKLPSRQEIEDIEVSSEEGGGALKEKATFQLIFLSLAVLLIFLPFITTFNEVLTRVVEKFYIYTVIQDYIVPYLSRLVGVVLIPFGFQVIGTPSGLYLPKIPLAIDIAWNCIGWQSMILIIITFFAGLQGQYTKYSKGQTILIGILGTFIVNILRITSVVLMAVRFGYFPAVIYHDYFSNMLIVLWLFFFWWFSYAYILEPTAPAPVRLKRLDRLSAKGNLNRLFSTGFKRIKNLFTIKNKQIRKKVKTKKNKRVGITKNKRMARR